MARRLFIANEREIKIFSLLTGNNHLTLQTEVQLLNAHSADGVALFREKDHDLYKALAVSRVLRFIRKSSTHRIPATWNVVIPCYNYGEYLSEAINSVLFNKADYMITIVDDNSS